MANIILPGGFDTHLPTPGTVFTTVVDVVRGAVAGGAAAAAQDITPTAVTNLQNVQGANFSLNPNSAVVGHQEYAAFVNYTQQQFQRIYQALGGLIQGGASGDVGFSSGFGGGGNSMLPIMMLLLLNPTTPGATPALDTTTLLLVMMMGQGGGGGFGGGGFGGGGGDTSMLMMLLLLGGL